VGSDLGEPMPITVHHKPVDASRTYKLHAWDGSTTWDLAGMPGADGFGFTLGDMPDARKLRFLFHAVDPQTHHDAWEPDDYIRRIRLATPAEIWSFDYTARLLYEVPAPPGVTFHPGDVLTFKVVTQQRFKGGRLFVWNPYHPADSAAYFPESSRNDPVSTFSVPLAAWMTGGFHFKLVGTGSDGKDFWEPDASNRVWRPGDGSTVWLKSGQVSVRSQPLTLASLPVEVLFPAALGSPPALNLLDPIEGLPQSLSGTMAPFPGSALFRLGSYAIPIYPDAAYTLSVLGGFEGTPPLARPFPADPDDLTAPSRFILGVDGWVKDFPTIATSVTLIVEPKPATSFAEGLTVQVGVGSAPAYQTVTASLDPDGTWRAKLNAVQTIPNWVRLLPAASDEPRPYDWIDVRRLFTPPGAAATYFTAEGVYGLTTRGKVSFADPLSRTALMQATFGQAVVTAGVFSPTEMPHGATVVGNGVYFVLHAPHAAWAALVLIDEHAPGGPARRQFPMNLTGDALYWWCKVPSQNAAPGTRYRFALNDDVEVMDPAARQVFDSGNFQTGPGDDPKDPGTSWSMLLDVAAVSATAHAAPWQTMGWEALLLYELHPKRFTDLSPGTLAPLDLLADELQTTNHLGKPGYLRNLPVTALQLMPVSEFKSTNSWGYNPAFFFAVDSGYGSAPALARLVRAAHACGRGVLLDVVYNHMNDSPLTLIAKDVYRNGDAWGDRITNAHPMVKEFFRQATVYLWRTFGLDGFRLDSTKTIVENNGWDFLGSIRGALRAAASAEGRAWPYFVGENDPKYWDITNPAWSVLDGQWDIDEVYRLGDVAYDPWQPSDDHAGALKADMDVPQTWGRPFYEATRFGESHDSVSGQADNQSNKRIAARPPFGMGFQMAKAVGTVTLLANGVPMLFMGEEVGETRFFSFDNEGPVTNPQLHDLPAGMATDNTRILAWFRSLLGLRNDPAKGLRGNDNSQVVRTGRRTVAFTCGSGQRLFVVVTFGTENQQQDSSWLGLPGGSAYKEIFNSSWPVFQVEFEQERTNGGYDAQIGSGQLLNLPRIGAVVLERR
jgi:1,4-alpha-glucan branching enzyme